MTKKKKIVLVVLACLGAVVLFVGVIAITVLNREVEPHIKADLKKMH